jgi:hypothetical protein
MSTLGPEIVGSHLSEPTINPYLVVAVNCALHHDVYVYYDDFHEEKMFMIQKYSRKIWICWIHIQETRQLLTICALLLFVTDLLTLCGACFADFL